MVAREWPQKGVSLRGALTAEDWQEGATQSLAGDDYEEAALKA
jgi:hypothetical protein